jgi:hypothetical protein
MPNAPTTNTAPETAALETPDYHWEGPFDITRGDANDSFILRAMIGFHGDLIERSRRSPATAPISQQAAEQARQRCKRARSQRPVSSNAPERARLFGDEIGLLFRKEQLRAGHAPHAA